MLPLHFFTIVLNGEPFIRYHLSRMQALPADIPWHWHIVEGMADLTHCDTWAKNNGAIMPGEAIREDGRSIDGTAEYLDEIAAQYPNNVTVYHPPRGRIWDGRLEMVGAPIPNIREECVLWQIDSDELWTTDQFMRLRELFRQNPDRTAAVFYCHYYVAPTLVINRARRYPEIEWRRAWRFKPGMRWLAHAPPVLVESNPTTGQFQDVADIRPMTPSDTEKFDLIFQHFAYVTEEQLRFKEMAYGYRGITEQWHRMMQAAQFPIPLRRYFDWPWVHPQALVDPVEACGVVPLARVTEGKWNFDAAPAGAKIQPQRSQRGVVFFQRGAANPLTDRAIRAVRAVHPELGVHVERVADGEAFDKMRLLTASPFEVTLFLDADAVVLDRLDFGFEMARRHGLACAISDCPWVRRNAPGEGDAVEYNAGVLFFSARARDLFESWAAIERARGTIRIFDPRSAALTLTPVDHTAFSLAIAQRKSPPFILPMNWNFRPQSQRTWWGPIKVWHDASEPPAGVVAFTQNQANLEAIVQYTRLG